MQTEVHTIKYSPTAFEQWLETYEGVLLFMVMRIRSVFHEGIGQYFRSPLATRAGAYSLVLMFFESPTVIRPTYSCAQQ